MRGKRIMIIVAAVVAVVFAVAAGFCAHRSVTAKHPPAAPAAPDTPPGSPSPSPTPTPYAEAPETLPSPPPMWGAGGAQQQQILTTASAAAVNWADALFSRSYSGSETAYISAASKYQTAAMTASEQEYETTPTGRTDWAQLHDQECAVTVSNQMSVPPDNYTANYPGPHVPSLGSQWQVVDFTTEPSCKKPLPDMPPVPSVSYERLVELVPAQAGDPDGAWVVSSAYSSWTGSSQAGSWYGVTSSTSTQSDGS